MTIKHASLGSVSHATLRPEDLLNAFGDELERQILRNGAYFSLPENFGERDRLNTLHGEHCDCFDAEGNLPEESSDEALELIERLTDALQTFAPPYCYFGAHCGDGSDFGYWPSHDSIEELPTVEDSDEAKELGEDCKAVNDHGNVTVYGGDGSVLLVIV